MNIRFYASTSHWYWLIILMLCTTQPCPAQAPNPSIIGFFEQRDLELAGSLNESNKGVIAKIDHTKTIFGKARLAAHLSNPIANLAVLEKRQAAIRAIADNPELATQLAQVLGDIKAHQSSIAFFGTPLDPTAQKSLNAYFYSSQYFKEYNTSTSALTGRDILKKILLLHPAVEHLLIEGVFAMINNKNQASKEKIKKAIEDLQKFKHDVIHCANESPAVMQSINAKLPGLIPATCHAGHHHHGHNHHHHGHSHNHNDDNHRCLNCLLEPSEDASQFLKNLHRCFSVCHIAFTFANLPATYDLVTTQLAVLNEVYTHILGMQHCFEAITKLQELAKQHAAISEILPVLLVERTDPANEELMELLNDDDEFQPDEQLGFFSSVGPTLRAYSLLRQLTPDYAPLFEAIGDLDAYASMAHLMTAHQDKSAKFCFARFKNGADKPYIAMRGMWNCMLDADTVVTNTVTLGPDGNNMIIITGPNKAGKSSIIKAFGLNIVLAQSFGIAAADDVEMALVDALLTYMTVTDDITNDTSLMVAEMARADMCLKIIVSLKPGQFACALVDDSLFKGTTFQKGQELAYQFVQSLGSFNNCCGLVATHTQLLTQLATQNSSIFANMYIPTVNVAGTIASTFTLQPGCANPDDVLAIVRAI